MKTVLWAGNDETTSSSLEAVFKRREIRLIHASNGMDALERLAAYRPDALVVEERFSHREWLLNIVGNDPELLGTRIVQFPEKARLRQGTGPFQSPADLIPVPVFGPIGWPPGVARLLWQAEEADSGGNRDHWEAMRELARFHLELLMALEQAEAGASAERQGSKSPRGR